MKIKLKLKFKQTEQQKENSIEWNGNGMELPARCP